jgi:hypothetical protein
MRTTKTQLFQFNGLINLEARQGFPKYNKYKNSVKTSYKIHLLSQFDF